MAKFELTGRVVSHTVKPRFTMIFKPNTEGGWDGGDVAWIDEPLIDGMSAADQARVIARLAREAGDFFISNLRRDWVQDAVIARASALKLTSYEVAKRTGGAVSEDHVRAYITREKSMGSHKLQHVLRVLGLKITE